MKTNTWEDKRQEILIRDNFTCQSCKQFNPELGTVQFINKTNGQVELHNYINSINALQSTYSISQDGTGYTFEINFGDCWPVFPIMQVHHKRYVNGKEQWDYENSELITLCKRCHVDLHMSESIPIYSENNILIEERMFIPNDNGSGRKHQCDEWTFIQKVGGGEYVLSNVHPVITSVVWEHENAEEVILAGEKTLNIFMRKYFPRYSQKLTL